MSFLAVLFVVLGVFLLIKNVIRKNIERRKEQKREKSEGEILQNPYILEHERKIIDDEIYEEYVEWCKFRGELPVDKKGFDEHRTKEWKLQNKIKKSMR